MTMLMANMSNMVYVMYLNNLFMLVLLVGVVLFIVWASRLKAAQLKNLIVWLLVVGVVGALVTAKYSMKGNWDMNMKKGMEYMDMMENGM